MFEGWSTSVEEAKILDKKILLSNIKVHKEQNPKRSYYFNPDDDLKLSKIINKIVNEKVLKKNLKLLKKNYSLNRAKFANNYYKIIKYTYFN